MRGRAGQACAGGAANGGFIRWLSVGNYRRSPGVNWEWGLREAAKALRGQFPASGFHTLYEKAAARSQLFGSAFDFSGQKLEAETNGALGVGACVNKALQGTTSPLPNVLAPTGDGFKTKKRNCVISVFVPNG